MDAEEMNLRHTALSMANQPGRPIEDVLARAAAYLAFLKNETAPAADATE